MVRFLGEDGDLNPQIEEVRAIKWVFPNELSAYLIFPQQMEKMEKLLKEFGI